MAKQRIVNYNYIHTCAERTVEMDKQVASITSSALSSEELIRVLNFYLFAPPVLKDAQSKEIAKKYGCRYLGDLGWKGTKGLCALERELLKSAEMSFFCFLRSKSIKETLESMNLTGKICVHHARAVLQQESSLEMREDGAIKCDPKESRMVCLFRHIRNAIAHNRTYVFTDTEANDTILLEDLDDAGNITARILIRVRTLLEWAEIIEKVQKATETKASEVVDGDSEKIAS